MEKTKLSSKGQITIPKRLRDLYRWEAGLEFVVIDTGVGILLKPSRPFEPTSIEEVGGAYPTRGSPSRSRRRRTICDTGFGRWGMIAVDTNVVVRFLLADDPAQSVQARDLFAAEEVFLPDAVVLETVWLLGYSYELDKATTAAGLRRLFGLANVHLRNAAEMALALEWYDHGLDMPTRCTWRNRSAARGW